MFGAFPNSIRPRRLKDELQAQLDRTCASGSKHGVEGGFVRRGTATTECTDHGGIGECRLAVATGGAIGICEIGMVEDIEAFHTELRFDPFSEFKVLTERQVDVMETGIAENVAAHGAECSDSVREQERLPVEANIAAASAIRDCRVQ